MIITFYREIYVFVCYSMINKILLRTWIPIHSIPVQKPTHENIKKNNYWKNLQTGRYIKVYFITYALEVMNFMLFIAIRWLLKEYDILKRNS